MSAAYLIAKQVLMGLLLISAFSFFAVRLRRLLAIMQGVQGSTPVPVPRFFPADSPFKTGLFARLGIFFADILGQRNVRRKTAIGLAHTAIFFGFLFIQVHSLELMVRGVIPSFSAAAWVPSAYAAYMFLADFAALFCLCGFGYALYRRLCLRPSYLPEGRDAFLVITFTVTIVLTFQLINALESVSSYAANGPPLQCVPVSHALALLMGMEYWPAAIQKGLFEIIYWVHIGTILAFLVYIPGSKHLHLLAAIPNVLLKPLRIERCIVKTDVEDENAESFGLGRINEINWKQVLDLYACTECGRCEEQCPAANTGKNLSPRKLIAALKTELFDQAGAIIGNAQVIPPLVRPQGQISTGEIWDCTTCRACEEVCPVNIQHLDFMFELRKHQVLMEAAFPAELGEAFTNLENQSNPWGLSTASRGDWAQGMGVPHISQAPDAEIVYFAGSALSLDDRGKQVSKALLELLRRAGIKAAYLGAEEQDSGDDARRSGNEYLAQAMIQANVETLNGYGVKTLLTACPHTYNILKNEYPQFSGRYTVLHHSEFLAGLLDSGKLRVKKPEAGLFRPVYHDSCYLGRWNAIYDAPRNILRRIAGEGALREMTARRDKSLCCGAGGARMFMEENGERINQRRSKQALAAGADLLVTACPYCLTMLSDGMKELGANLPCQDIAELLLERLAD